MPHAVTIATPGLQALILCGPGSSFPTFTANPDENPKALLPIANRPMVWYPLEFCYRAGITNREIAVFVASGLQGFHIPAPENTQASSLDQNSTTCGCGVFYYTLSCQNNQETKTNDQPADITLVCPPSAAAAISTALNTNPFLTGLPYPRPDLLAPKDLDQNTGTAEILRLPELQAAVTSDFLVLPCDLVCELGADKLLQAWMVKSASLGDLLGVGGSNSNNANATRSGNGDATTTTAAAPAPRSGGLGVWYQTKTATPVKGEETDFIATVPLSASSVLPAKGSLFPHMSKLVYSMPTDSLKDLVEDRKGFPVRHGLLRRHPRIRMLTTHRDAHIYIFPHWVMQFIKENERLETIGEDVVGWWVKAGWQKGLSTKLGLDKILRGQGYGDSDNSNDRNSNGEEKQHASIRGGGGNSSRTLGVDSTTISAPTSVAPVSRVDSQGSNNSSSSSSPPSKTEAATITAADQNEPETADSDETLVPPMVAYIHPSQEESAPLIRRVDTAQLLLQTSLQLAKLPSLEETDTPSPFAHARKVAYPEGVKPRTTISRQDSLVADNVTVEEKTSIKESCIGANCQIGEGAKLSQCLLMDGVVVGRNCKLTKCILGRRSQLGEGCVLTDCEVQENLLVEAKTEAKEEKFMSSSGLEATEQELDAFADDGRIDSEGGDDEVEAA